MRPAIEKRAVAPTHGSTASFIASREGEEVRKLVPHRLIADGSLNPRIGVERSWRDIAAVAEQLRDRRVADKAVLLVDAG